MSGDLMQTWAMAEAITLDNSLSPAARVVGVALLTFRNRKTGRCFPSYDTVAEAVGMKRRHVINQIASLIDAGWLSASKAAGKSNAFQFAFERLEGVQDSAPPVVHHSAPVSDLGGCTVRSKGVHHGAPKPKNNPLLLTQERGGTSSPFRRGRADAHRGKADPVMAMLVAGGWADGGE